MLEIIEPPEWQRRDPYWQGILYSKWAQEWEREQAEFMQADEDPDYIPWLLEDADPDYDDIVGFGNIPTVYYREEEKQDGK